MTLHPEPFAQLRETHTGLVVLCGDRAYKTKKPVATDFLDFTTVAARERACRRELELNRRWAADVYLGLGHFSDPSGAPREPVLTMRRMPESRRLRTMLADGVLGTTELSELAVVLAHFHHNAPRGDAIDRAGQPEALRQRWTALLRPLAAEPAGTFDPDDIPRLQRLALRFVDGRGPLLDERIAAGRIVDGHGDLMTEDIFALDDGFRILDCLDFDDQLRFVDCLDDIAFLAMDLEFLGRPGLAGAFLTAYRRATSDTAPASLLHHYIAYRATVRAKTNGIRAAQGDPGAAAHARRHVRLALRHLERGAVRLVLVGGLPGTGKSTIAARVARATGARLISSDAVRAELRAIGEITGAGGHFGAGAYRPEAKSAVYSQLLNEARQALAHGDSVVLDASWLDAGERASALALADETRSEPIALRCACPRDLAAARMTSRPPGDSEATAQISDSLAANASEWPEATVIDTSGSVDAAVAQGLRRWIAREDPSAADEARRLADLSPLTTR